MSDIALALEHRRERGSAASRRLRASGRVPAVVYGHGDNPVAVSVDARELRSALAASARGSVLFGLTVGGEEHLAIVREIQRHPVRRTVAHIDFQVVSRDEIVPAEIAVVLVGEALAVTRQGGTIDHSLLTLHVRAKPADIPASFEVDISEMEIGDALRVADIVIPEGLTTEVDPETPVVVALAPRVEVEEVAEGEEVAAAEEAAAGGEEPERTAAGGEGESGGEGTEES
jgi:large subunit ribosomal protein L25